MEVKLGTVPLDAWLAEVRRAEEEGREWVSLRLVNQHSAQVPKGQVFTLTLSPRAARALAMLLQQAGGA